MKRFTMKCGFCGQVMAIEANDRDEAVNNMKTMTDQKWIDDHWAEFHKEDANPKPTVEQSHQMIDEMLQEEMIAPM